MVSAWPNRLRSPFARFEADVRREAARYRTRLRETEAERDKYREQIIAWRRSRAEELASTGDTPLSRPGDLWEGGVQLEELLLEDGAIDSEKVKAAQQKVLAEHPDWRAQPIARDFDGGVRQPVKPDAGPDFGAEPKRAAGSSSKPLGQL